MVNSFRGIFPFLKNYFRTKKELQNHKSDFQIKKVLPNFFDRYDQAGSMPLHYFYQDLFIAQKIFKDNPDKHVDIGSRIDGFVAHIASFREIEIFDIREINQPIPSVKFVRADLMADNFNLKNYCDSVSSLHAIEHFGLGRYGDPININGHLIALKNINALLKSGGKFYFSTPIGPQRIEYDAHRVFRVSYLLHLFQPDYDLISFSYISDSNQFFPEVTLNESDIENNFGCNYGCGIFEMKKK
jgi:SAM-dependent methyltransferase